MEIDIIIKEIALINGINNKESKIKSFLKGSLSDEDILSIFEYVKYAEAGLILKNIGFPTLTKFLFNLLELLQDINWPINKYTIEILIKKADKYLVINTIKEIFKTYPYDSNWQSFIIFYILKNLSKKYQKLISKELLEISMIADNDNACIYAANILFEKKLINRNERERVFQFLKSSFEKNDDFISDIEELEKLIK
jgi:hypothetical protein